MRPLLSDVSWRRVVGVTVLLLGLSVVSAVLWNRFKPSDPGPTLYDNLPADPRILHLEFRDRSHGLVITTISLRPEEPSSFMEDEKGGVVTRLTASITEQTPSGYRVLFEKTVIESGSTKDHLQQNAIFSFGRSHGGSHFGTASVLGFYGRPPR